jgi:hypothetical protein
MSRFSALATQASKVCAGVFGDRFVYETLNGVAYFISAMKYETQIAVGLGIGIDSKQTEFGIPFGEICLEPKQGDLITESSGNTWEVLTCIDMGPGEWRVSVHLVDSRHAIAGDRV